MIIVSRTMDWGERSGGGGGTGVADELTLDLDDNLAELSLERTITSSLKVRAPTSNIVCLLVGWFLCVYLVCLMFIY